MAGGSISSCVRSFVSAIKCSSAQARLRLFDAFAPVGGYFQLWLFLSIIVAAYWQWRFLSASTVDEQKKLHRWLCGDFVLLDCAVLLFFLEQRGLASAEHSSFFEMIVLWGVIGPLIALIRDVRRDNVLQIGRQGILSMQSLAFSWLSSISALCAARASGLNRIYRRKPPPRFFFSCRWSFSSRSSA